MHECVGCVRVHTEYVSADLSAESESMCEKGLGFRVWVSACDGLAPSKCDHSSGRSCLAPRGRAGCAGAVRPIERVGVRSVSV